MSILDDDFAEQQAERTKRYIYHLKLEYVAIAQGMKSHTIYDPAKIQYNQFDPDELYDKFCEIVGPFFLDKDGYLHLTKSDETIIEELNKIDPEYRRVVRVKPQLNYSAVRVSQEEGLYENPYVIFHTVMRLKSGAYIFLYIYTRVVEGNILFLK